MMQPTLTMIAEAIIPAPIKPTESSFICSGLHMVVVYLLLVDLMDWMEEDSFLCPPKESTGRESIRNKHRDNVVREKEFLGEKWRATRCRAT